MELLELPLDEYGAEGFSLSVRLDGSGHRDGRVDPHINTDLLDQDGEVMRMRALRDLSNNQLPGFNGMQNGC